MRTCQTDWRTKEPGAGPLHLSGGMSDDSFPVEDVEAWIADERLQRDHALAKLPERERADLETRRQNAIAVGASASCCWIYFVSPAWTWENLCGREGWLLYDPETGEQQAFVLTVMN